MPQKVITLLSLASKSYHFAQFGNFLRLFEESVFIFQFLNDKIHNYVKQNIIVNFIIQKLKNKHTFLKKGLTEREETKTRYFAPSKAWVRDCFLIFSLKRVVCKANTLLPFLLSSKLDSCKNAKILWQPLLIGYVCTY